MRALDEAASRTNDEVESVRLQDSARKFNVRATDEAHLQYHQPDETLTRENDRLSKLTSITGTPPARISPPANGIASERDLRRLAREVDAGA